MSTLHRAAKAMLLIATATATLTSPAVAATTKIVHQTPKVPIVVDGHAYAARQIHRFDGRPLYLRPAKDGKSLVAYTRLSRFKAFLRTQGIRLPAPGGSDRAAHASGAGHWTKFCTDRFEQGWCYTINSGTGISNL